MRDPNNPCLFCNSKISDIEHENELAYASYDTYPVSEHHCLIIPKRHVVDYFELSDEDMNNIKTLDKCQRFNDPGEFTQGMNSFFPIYE